MQVQEYQFAQNKDQVKITMVLGDLDTGDNPEEAMLNALTEKLKPWCNGAANTTVDLKLLKNETEVETKVETKAEEVEKNPAKKVAKKAAKKTTKRAPKSTNVLYNRSVDAHKDALGTVLNEVAPKWEENMDKAKEVSMELDGKAEIFDKNGDVLQSFSDAVKEGMEKQNF